jgi:hypothetical protein
LGQGGDDDAHDRRTTETAADAVTRGLKQKAHDDAVLGGGCLGLLVLFFVLWGGLSVLLGGSTIAVLVGGAVAFAASFWLAWRLDDRYGIDADRRRE